MNSARRSWLLAPVALTGLAVAGAAFGQTQAPAPRRDRRPDRPAPPETVAEIRHTLDEATRRFNARDAAGVLAYVSEEYRTGSLSKAGIAEQLRAFFAVNEQVAARVRIDSARVAGDTLWVYTSGDVAGRPRWLSRMIPMLSWERELEAARREKDGWRLIGYGQ